MISINKMIVSHNKFGLYRVKWYSSERYDTKSENSIELNKFKINPFLEQLVQIPKLIIIVEKLTKRTYHSRVWTKIKKINT